MVHRSIAEWQTHALAECTRSGARPESVSVSWDPQVMFTSGFLSRFLRQASGLGAARATVALGRLHEAYGANVLGNPDHSQPGRLAYDVEVCARASHMAGDGSTTPERAAVQDVEVPMSGPVRERHQPGRMDRPLLVPVEPDFVWRVDHWCDLLVCNLLMLPLEVAQIPASGSRGRAVDIHPTAVVERAQLGDGVRIGPHALVRNAIIADGATVSEYGSVRDSYVGPGTIIQSYTQILESVIGTGSVISFRTSVRGSVIMDGTTSSAPVVARSIIGHRVFLGRGLNISASNLTGEDVAVWRDGRRVNTGMALLGCAVGDGARVGGLHLPAGYQVPPSCILAPRGLAPLAADAPAGVPLIEHNGRLRNLHLS